MGQARPPLWGSSSFSPTHIQTMHTAARAGWWGCVQKLPDTATLMLDNVLSGSTLVCNRLRNEDNTSAALLHHITCMRSKSQNKQTAIKWL
jgi:hypothetical protein